METDIRKMHHSRRRHPRVEIMGQIRGELFSRNEPLVVRDLSSGGFGVESTVAFPIGAIHQFLFTSAEGVEVLVMAEARHCHQANEDARSPRFVSGFAFVADPYGHTQRAVDRLLEAATAVLVFE